jgi:AraC-like DNA-binding protein
MTEIFDDINKMYMFSKPCEALAAFIEFYSESAGESTVKSAGKDGLSVRLFPSFTPTIWLNLGKPYQVQLAGQTLGVSSSEDILIVRNETVTRFISPADHIFTIKFFPGALERLLGISQTGLLNKVVEVTAVLPPYLIARIKSQHHFNNRITILNDFFLRQLRGQKKQDHYINFVKDSIDFCNLGGISFNASEIAEKMFVSSKTINRYFSRVVGTPPKKYFSILRARKALPVYLANKKSFDPSDFGFYDMSHFYKEMTNFTGASVNAGAK